MVIPAELVNVEGVGWKQGITLRPTSCTLVNIFEKQAFWWRTILIHILFFTTQNKATEMEMRNKDTSTTIHHNPLRYMVEEGRPSQARLQGATDMVTTSSLNNNYTTSHTGKLTWEGSRTDAIIAKITGEGTFEQVTPGKVLQLRIEIKTDLKGATTSLNTEFQHWKPICYQ